MGKLVMGPRLGRKVLVAMKPMKVMKCKQRLRRTSLRTALVQGLKSMSPRDDLVYKETASEDATVAMQRVPYKDRAGYPLKRPKGAVNPAYWKTKEGKRVIVDFSRSPWLPDEWGQGVKLTNRTAKSKYGGGGTYTVFMSPDGQTFYHKKDAEAFWGEPMTYTGGFKGQLRTAWLQGIQCKRTYSDSSFLKILSKREKAHLPTKDELHFCVISARRANTQQGVRDIATVQNAFQAAGVAPTWYVDAPSLKEYQALGLQAVVGGKLTQARNKALADAQRKGKACVQCSDDITEWDYHHGPMSAERTDEANNAAYAAATRYIITPVGAARFILAKMRGVAEGKPPQLGGVYVLGSCARTFGGSETSRKNFILGDFFVADRSKLKFDEALTLKEDYDFTCQHIKTHGSVMRCNRLCVHAKHYSNSGGAVDARDKKGLEERRNMGILFTKWPNAIFPHIRRKNEVALRWPGGRNRGAEPAEEEEDDDSMEC